ncbi:MAG: tryptophan synthase subunit alpha [Eubacteriales bacterium]
MTSRITQTFQELKKTNKKALITYITAGDPSIEITEELVYAMEKEGGDIIELGIPYSDPLADGPVIQRAAARALDHATNVDKIFNTIEKMRKKTQVPLVFLLYFNSIFRYGIERFISNCKNTGVDGLIIPDLPFEERVSLQKILEGHDIDLIPLVAPTSEERIKRIVKNATGFIYCVSSLGVTGVRDDFGNIDDFMRKVRNSTDLPLSIGFGISDRTAILRLKDLADGLIVGSAIIKKIEEGIPQGNSIILVKEFVHELKSALQ